MITGNRLRIRARDPIVITSDDSAGRIMKLDGRIANWVRNSGGRQRMTNGTQDYRDWLRSLNDEASDHYIVARVDLPARRNINKVRRGTAMQVGRAGSVNTLTARDVVRLK